MVKLKDVLVSTTDVIEGTKIIEHLKPVSAHIVLGTNVFSDFLGSFTDVFGGKSNSYQKKLNEIYEDAIKKIKQSCYDIGGNCVLGLKIDIDEISGKGKSMFMITAIGTAVYAEIKVINKNTSNALNNKVALEDIYDLRYKNKIMSSVEEGRFQFNDESWQYIISNQMDEILTPILNYFVILCEENEYAPSVFIEYEEKLKIYIGNLPDYKNKVDQLYSIIKITKNKKSALRIINIMKELFLLDFDKTIELLGSEELSKKKRGLKIATLDKLHYDSNDVDGLNKLIKSIGNSFKELGKKTIKKKTLYSKEQEIWICQCDCSNKLKDNHNYCSSCRNNIYGFEISELKPLEVITHLKDRVNLINELIL